MGKAALAEERGKPQRHHHRHAALAGQAGKGALVEMIVMIVADHQQVDPRQGGDRNAAFHIAPGPKPRRPRKGRQIGIGKNIQPADADQKGGMAKPGQKIALLTLMLLKRADRFGARHHMAFRYFDLAKSALQHFEEEGTRMLHPALAAHRAAPGVAEGAVRQMMPRARTLRALAGFRLLVRLRSRRAAGSRGAGRHGGFVHHRNT